MGVGGEERRKGGLRWWKDREGWVEEHNSSQEGVVDVHAGVEGL